MPKDPLLVGLSGKKGAGKDTAARYIATYAHEIGLVAHSRAFADLVKQSLLRLFLPDISLGEAVLVAERVKKRGIFRFEDRADNYGGQTSMLTFEITGRQALQRQGTEAHRDVFGPNFWVDALLPPPQYGDWRPSFIQGSRIPDIAVVTDVRFDNEAERIRQLGGQVWSIDRQLSGDVDLHPSEAGVSPEYIDRRIPNHGTLEALDAEIKTATHDLIYGGLQTR